VNVFDLEIASANLATARRLTKHRQSRDPGAQGIPFRSNALGIESAI
jgi:hypothetical protein